MQKQKLAMIINIKQIMYFSVIMLLYIIGINIPIISQIVGIGAFLTCLLYIIVNKPEKAFLHFILNLSFSIEAVLFATGKYSNTVVYSFIVLPFINILGVFIINLFIFLRLLIKRKNGKIVITIFKDESIDFIKNFVFYMAIIGILIFGVTLIFNDNNINNIKWYPETVKAELFRMFMIFLTLMNTIIIVKNNDEYRCKLETELVSMLCSLFIVALIAQIFNLHGYRMGSTNVSALPLFAFFGIGLIAFIKYVKTTRDKLIIIVFSLGLFILMIIKSTPLGGKWFIAVFITLIFFIYNYTESQKGLIFSILLLFITILAFESNILEIIFKDNDYMLEKLSEVKTISGNIDDLSQSDASIAFRLDEVNNVFIELQKNPIYLLFGKGIVGTINQHTLNYSWSAVGTFSSNQASSGVFFQMHESIAVILLKYGMVGIGGWLYVVLKVLRRVKKSPWATIGLLWIIFYFDVYNSMLFGAVCLVLALYNDNENAGQAKQISE